jgi:hypothetical protein
LWRSQRVFETFEHMGKFKKIILNMLVVLYLVKISY